MKSRLKKYFCARSIIAFFIFFVLGLILTYPLLFKFKTFIPYFYSSDEIFGVIRQFWWYKFCFLKHISYTSDSMMVVPFGLVHAKIFIWPLWEVVGRFFSIVFTNELIAYNLIIYLGFMLSAIFTYLLSYYITKDQFSAILSGIIYAFCPYYFVRTWQHFGLTQIQWLPLCLYTLFRLRERRNIPSCVFLSFVLALGVSTDYQYSFFMYIMTVLFILFVLFYDIESQEKAANYTGNKWKLPGFLLLSILFSLLLSIASMYPMLKGIFFGHAVQASAFNPFLRSFEDLFVQSAKPLSYFLPAVTHPIFGNITEQFLGTQLYGTSLTEHTLYLGWVPLILAFVAFKAWWKKRKDERTKENFYIGFFIFLAIAAWLFSQPPWWDIFGLKIYMPSFFIYKILPMFRAYCRFGIVVMLAVAILAGFGFKYIIERFKNFKIRLMFIVLCCSLVLFEFWNYPPYKVIDVSRPPEVYNWLKAQPEDTVIAEYPLDAGSPNEIYKFYQTKHEKRIINGSLPGSHANNVAQTITRLSDSGTPGVLRWMGVKYVLVHKNEYLKTELTEDKEDLIRISGNPGLKLVKDFPAESCPDAGIRCVRETGPIDVYEVIAQPKEPKVAQ